MSYTSACSGSYNLDVDDAYIGTISTPEPSSFVLAALGGLSLAGAAWRRRLLGL